MNREPLFHFVLDYSQELICRYDARGRIHYSNKRLQEVTGYEAKELMGAYVGDLYQEVFTIEQGRTVLKKEFRDVEKVETIIYRKNKTCFPVSLRTASTTYAGETVYFCMAVDMTEYKENIRRIEEKTQEVEESMRTRDTFVANVTHELRTPANGIKGHAQILLEQEKDPEKITCIKTILDSCTTMEGIINNILDFSKLEAGKFQLDEKPISFYEFIHKTQRMFTTMAAHKGLRFVMNLAPEVPDKLIADELRLTQILNNLVSNALKFTSQGYVGIEVTVNAQMHDEVELFFVVADTGIGLSKEDKDKLFKSFSQVDASITRKYGGTGLGLSITKELVTMMHGDIWAEGEKGKGATFSFTLCLKMQQQEEKTVSVPQVQFASTGVSQMKVERDLMYEFGSEINARELKSNFEKLNLSADMECWYKAEDFAANVKQLLQGGSKELQKAAFRMEMAVRKSDYEKFRACEETVEELLKTQWKYSAVE